MAIFEAIVAAAVAVVQFVFTSGAIIAQAIRFIGSTLITAYLNRQDIQGPRLTDLKIQTSSYGSAIPRVYGETVRTAGNVIDKSDILETRHKKSNKVFGIGISSTTTYTYRASLAVLLAEGVLPDNGLKKIFANGKVIFDRDVAVVVPEPVPNPFSPAPDPFSIVGTLFHRDTQVTQSVFSKLTYYRGTQSQDVDPYLQTLHGTDPVPAYRGSAYVVIEDLQLKDWGNGVPNLEFEYETAFPTVQSCVEDLARAADVTLYGGRLGDFPLRGYIIANQSAVWGAIEPLAGAFSFDLVQQGNSFRAKLRGRTMVYVLSEEQLAARPSGGSGGSTAIFELTRQDSQLFPDQCTISYLDVDRDYQINTQRAFRTQGVSQSKADVEVAIVLTADEARELAGRTLQESIASVGRTKVTVKKELRWIPASSIVGIPVGGLIQPFRIMRVTSGANEVIEWEGAFDDPISYVQSGNLGDSGVTGSNELELPGDTIFQPIDASILADEDDTGFYYAVTGTGTGWRGAYLFEADGVGSPLTYDLLDAPGVPALIGDCTSTLASGPTFAFDNVSTVDVEIFGSDTPESATEAEVLVNNANFAWIGAPSGESGEYINFKTATPSGSPNIWRLSGLLRGRRGTEYAVGLHGSGERFVLIESGAVYRVDTGPIAWGATNTYRADPIDFDDEDSFSTPTTFTNSGEGKRPYSPAHLLGTRNGSNSDILLSWERRTRFRTPGLGGGPVPLGEETERYEVDVYNGATVVRTLTASTTSVNYSAANQTTDGLTPGNPVKIDVYQLSTVRGRGHVTQGTV